MLGCLGFFAPETVLLVGNWKGVIFRASEKKKVNCVPLLFFFLT